MCGDDPIISELKTSFQRSHISYGFDPKNDYVLSEYESDGRRSTFKITSNLNSIDITLNMLGQHNALNAAAAIVLCLLENIPVKVIKESLEGFMGIDRRMQILGEQVNEKSSKVYIDDYGHHPTEIQRTIEALKNSYPDLNLSMVFQPLRYTRTKDLFNEFIQVLKDVDNLILLDVYPAGEKPIKGIDSSNIKKSLEDSGFSNVELVENKDLVLKRITDSPDINTVFIFQGAGDISSISKQFEREYF